MSMMLSVYPIAALTIIALAAVAAAIQQAAGKRRRSDALAARADYEHRALINQSPPPPPLPVPRPELLRHALASAPTAPLRLRRS
ncbi:hypothetical protein [Mycobacterium avium]|uniref:hypothetical protein n=1 Tax=Mycobacterium avium TaxID=1764 RepID=UPI001CC383EA|nr:hypothetical protein [Mycobacterium avium]MBZ4622563.1 hypothetical protein [Mycobacterium avium subsp. hominissuis]